MNLVILQPKTSLEKWEEAAISEYQKKISWFNKIEILEVGTKKIPRQAQADKKNFENSQLLQSLRPDDFVYVLDERGKRFSSAQWAKQFETSLNFGKKRIVFVLGGAFGISEEVRKRGQVIFSLSDLTMNHHLACIVLMEQIYRGYTILKNMPYHNAD